MSFASSPEIPKQEFETEDYRDLRVCPSSGILKIQKNTKFQKLYNLLYCNTHIKSSVFSLVVAW
jgi:hypothetical protein